MGLQLAAPAVIGEAARKTVMGAWGKTIVIAAAALLLGLFVGGLAPRAELVRVKADLAAAEARQKRGAGAAALPLALGLGSLAAARERATAAGPPDSAGAAGVKRVPRFVPPDPTSGGPAEKHHGPFHDPDSFAAAKTAADLRAAQYREAFLEAARLTPEARTAFEATVQAMNDELGKAAEEIAADLERRSRRQQKLQPRDFADVGARVLDIYRRADDRFKAGLDETARAAATKTDFDLLTQIDIGSFQRLGETVQNMDRGAGFLNGPPPGGAPPTGGPPP